MLEGEGLPRGHGEAVQPERSVLGPLPQFHPQGLLQGVPVRQPEVLRSQRALLSLPHSQGTQDHLVEMEDMQSRHSGRRFTRYPST